MRTCGLLFGLLVVGCAQAWAAGDLRAGDLATVNKNGAEIKRGSTVIATLDKGTRIKVYYVFKEGGFARVFFTLGGKSYQGDMSLRDLDAPSRTEEKAPPSKSRYVADDKVVVIAKEAKLKLGDDVVGTIPEGTPLTVQKVKDEWLGVTAEVKGKATFGWIHMRDVDYPTMKEKEKPPPKKEPEKDK
ncbi:MAG: hypothetical protein FJ291_16150 [Planctomycetes bacterium]|nr:hypothetical protein [Planctomycetota bacterium]